MMKIRKILSILLAGTVAFSNVQISTAKEIVETAENSATVVTDVFGDVYVDWYTEYVQYVYDEALMTGIRDTDRFEPNVNITKAQVAQVLYNMEGRPDVKNQSVFEALKDVYDVEWYADAVSWAFNNEIVTGDLNTKEFSPNADVTREQLALMMFRYAGYKAYDTSTGSNFEGLVNADKISDWSLNGVKWAVGTGLVSGVEKDGMKDLAPQGNATRAQMAAILNRFCEAYVDKTVPSEIAELLGINPDEEDTDQDGLSNYAEIYIVGTDPTLVDTDGNGIDDGDEDLDGDLLSNILEIQHGTDPLEKDSDFDSISDYEEINEHGTKPCEEDTDGDGFDDGYELLLGMNPLSQCTDGVTLDSEKEVTQQLKEENISEALLGEDSAAVPSLTVTQSGNINKEIFIEETKLNIFSDSRAIVGEAIDISGSSFEEGELSFDLNSDISYINTEDIEESYPTVLIGKHQDGETEYLETKCEDGTVSAEIDGDGTYFVLDVKNLFDELGIVLPTVSRMSTLSDAKPLKYAKVDYEKDVEKDNGNGAAQVRSFSVKHEANSVAASADTVKVIKASSNAMAQADIVFIVDTTGSMADEIYNVKSNISYFVDALNEKGISAALALIDYEDITVDGYDSTRVHKNKSSNWFYNVDEYKTAIENLYLGWGGDAPECVVDALETARLLDMRASAGKIFVLVTDADYKVDNRYGIPSMAAEIELLKNAGVNCSVVSPTYEQSTYYNLYTETNGVWANIYGNFYEELMVLADKIGSDIVGDGYWIYLDGPVPVPVRLDAMPEEGSDVDTDSDGIPDIEELEGTVPSGYIDLDELVSKISCGAITGTDYGKVMMYKYLSNPVEEDSDYDGIKDGDEKDATACLNNSFDGKMLGYYDVADASYTLDYRHFFNSETTYSKNLCSASLMLANTIYKDCGFAYNAGLEITDITELMEYHGFENVIDYKLAKGYEKDGIVAEPYNDDDISEIAIGYHKVTHRGMTKTVLAVAIRGTNGTIEEWSSNFDMGDTETWKEDSHKGFYITEERIKSFVNQYVDVYLSDVEGLTYWITGHSRGAALANILAANLIDEGKAVYAYTFATPSTTISENRGDAKYNSIFNFTNTSDFVTYVPLREWDFGRFGITYSKSIEDANLESKWSEQTGVSNYNALSKSVITLATSRIAKSCCANWDEVHDRAGSQDINDEQYGYISNRAKRFCDLQEQVSLTGKHKGYKLNPSTAFVFQLGAEMLAGSAEQKANVKALLPEFWNSRYTGVLLLFLGDAARNTSAFENMEVSSTLVGDGHAPATYYVLTQN